MSKNKKETTKKYTQEELEAHPELTYEIKRKEPRWMREFKSSRHDHYPPQYIWLLNQPIFTHIIQVFSILLGFIFIFFGVLGALTFFGFTEERVWVLYEATQFFGWKGNAITGIILVIVGIIIIWSIPFYFIESVQKADSYLIIGSGLGLLFGFIYLIIIFADVIKYCVNLIIDSSQATMETYFYYPILLGLLTFPLLRALIIRHTILPSQKEMPKNYTISQYRKDRVIWRREFNKKSEEEYLKHWMEKRNRKRHHGKWRKWD